MTRHVILCSHNGERFIEAQIESIRKQSTPVDAIHVFDFASTDDTRNILRRLAAEASAAPLLLVEHTDAPGAAQSFFRAIVALAPRLAPDDCVFLADQDDIWLPRKVETVAARFERELSAQSNAEVAVFHDVEVVDSALQRLRPTYYTGSPFAIPRDLAADLLLLANPVIGHTLAVSGALLKAAARHLTHAAYLMHDWALVLLASRSGRIAFEPAALSWYRQHEANVLGAYGRRRRLEVFRRTVVFARRLVPQALAFANDSGKLPPSANRDDEQNRAAPWLDRCLRNMAGSAPWLAFPLLAAVAVARGPTLRRRMLGAALLVAGAQAALAGPAVARGEHRHS